MRINPYAFLLLAVIPACGAPHEFDEGEICIAPSVVAEFEAGDDLTFEVILDSCIDACARGVESSCDVRVEGDVIHLDATGSYREGGSRVCVAVCGVLSAQCVVPDLSPGTYTVRSGEFELSLTLPAAEPPALPDSCGYNPP